MSGADPAALQGMSADIDEMDQVVGQFLEFARGDDEPREAQDPAAMLADIREHYARLGRKVEVRNAAVPPFAFARMALRRAISNLVENALRYAGESVEVDARRGGAQL